MGMRQAIGLYLYNHRITSYDFHSMLASMGPLL